MASSLESTKIYCVVCQKGRGIFKCEGCSRSFCSKHSTDHRNELNQRLEELVVEHDILWQNHTQHIDTSQQANLENIDQWEQESIARVHRAAEEARQTLATRINERRDEFRNKLQQVSRSLRDCQKENDFTEIELQQWTRALDELKQELQNSATVRIEENPMSTAPRICFGQQETLDAFERVVGSGSVDDVGRVAIKTGPHECASVYGRNEYTTGQRVIRFRIEQLINNAWIFFGIASKLCVARIDSFASPTSYGWSNQNEVYINGLYLHRLSADVAQNDSVKLSIDCEQRRIQLENERTNHVVQLSVDLNLCPFPWVFHLNFREPATRVRIISPSN